MRDGVSFLWDRVEADLCRFSGVGPFVHDPLYNNLLPKEHRIRVKDNGLNPLILKLKFRNPILQKRPLAHLKVNNHP